jgi:hypothetical protein
VSLRDLLYCLTLEEGSPLFLQLSQRPSGEMDAVIPNTPEAEMKVERINNQVAAWCLTYWNDTNPGGSTFFWKLGCKAFCQVFMHKVGKCTWDLATQTVASPHAQSKWQQWLNLKIRTRFETSFKQPLQPPTRERRMPTQMWLSHSRTTSRLAPFMAQMPGKA